MTNPGEDLLATSEGVDEGSAASTAEGPQSSDPARDVTDATAGGAGLSGGDPEAAPAPPVDMESADSRETREQAGSGQQLEAGEG